MINTQLIIHSFLLQILKKAAGDEKSSDPILKKLRSYTIGKWIVDNYSCGVNYNLPLSDIYTRINSWSRFSEVKRLRIPARRATFWVVVVPRWLWTVCTNAARTTLTIIRYPLYVESALSRMSSLGTYIPQLTRKMNTRPSSYAHTDGRINFEASCPDVVSFVHHLLDVFHKLP